MARCYTYWSNDLERRIFHLRRSRKVRSQTKLITWPVRKFLTKNVKVWGWTFPNSGEFRSQTKICEHPYFLWGLTKTWRDMMGHDGTAKTGKKSSLKAWKWKMGRLKHTWRDNRCRRSQTGTQNSTYSHMMGPWCLLGVGNVRDDSLCGEVSCLVG